MDIRPSKIKKLIFHELSLKFMPAMENRMEHAGILPLGPSAPSGAASV
jgi:hypothetical protein